MGGRAFPTFAPPCRCVSDHLTAKQAQSKVCSVQLCDPRQCAGHAASDRLGLGLGEEIAASEIIFFFNFFLGCG